jgi:hypothetical protein
MLISNDYTKIYVAEVDKGDYKIHESIYAPVAPVRSWCRVGMRRYRVRSVTNSNNFTTIYDSAIDSLPRMTLGRVLIYSTSRESAEKLVNDHLARQLPYARKVYSECEKKMKLSSFLIDKLS